MQARSRRRTILVAIVAACAADAAILLPQGDATPSFDDASSSRAAPADARPPPLAAAPHRSPIRADEGTPVTSYDTATPPSASDDSPTNLVYGSEVDDPALPKERVPLAVTLVDPAGKPIPRAAVQAVWGEWRTKTYVADADGRVAMSVPRGTRALEVVGLPQGETRHFLLVHYHSLTGEEAETRVVVRVGAEVSGRVLRSDGTPCVGQQVRAFPTAFGFGSVATDANGAFRLGLLDSQVVDVECEIDSVRIGDTLAGTLRARARNVVAGTTDLVLIARAVDSNASLSIRVVSSTGEPIEGATLSTPRGPPHTFWIEGPTDESGRWRLNDLANWPQTIRVCVPAGQHGFPDGCDQPFAHLEPDGSEVELRLSPPARTVLTGRVIDAVGRPVERAWCAAFVGPSYLAGVSTNVEGRFSVVLPVAPGTRFQLSARDTDADPTARGVVSDLVAGASESTIVLEHVGPLESEARRRNRPRMGYIGTTGDQ